LKIQRSRWRHRLPVGLVLAVAVALVPEMLSGQTTTLYPRRDFQAWLSIDETHPISEKIDFLLGAGIRYGNDQGHLTYRRVTTGMAFHLRRFLTLEPYYQYSVGDSFSGALTPENRLALATTIGVPWKRWRISDRNLGERRFMVNGQEWRYRNRVELRRPVAIIRRQLSVFVWNEVYYSSLAGRWYRNRFALGAGRSLSNKVSIDVFYLHQNDGYSHPGDLNGVGMTIRTRF
jgi:Protein of unknown function (DUF2490)